MRAFVGREGAAALANIAAADLGSREGIDYYGLLDGRSARVEIGDSVVFGFRPQAFVTRALVAVVRGISRGRPAVAGLYDAAGKRTRTSP